MTTDPQVVTRTIAVEGLGQGTTAATILTGLRDRHGIVEINLVPQQDSLRISYDVKVLLFDDIEKAFSSYGVSVSPHIWMHLKACWYRFTDENARANANAKGGGCCSQPKDIYAQRRKRN